MPKRVIIKVENQKSFRTEFGRNQTQLKRIINSWIDRPIEYCYFLCLINICIIFGVLVSSVPMSL